jgi:voltage-gated potassium channel
VRWGAALFALVLVGGSLGYIALGFGVLDAAYQTVTTVTTVGFREVQPLTAGGKVFTMVLILGGVGTALYTFGVLVEALVEGHFSRLLGRRRMDRDIERLRGHVIICGWGRVGRAIARYVTGAGQPVVVVDRDLARLDGSGHPFVHGDATDDEVLARAGIDDASVLVAALNTDADNLYVTLSSRSVRPDLVIIARARTESSEPKLERAGANRVVNPQLLGGQRMAAFALQPHVAEFLDVVMHDGSLEFRLEEVVVASGSSLVDRSLRDSHLRDRTGALVLALRDTAGGFTTNPPPETIITPGQILIAIGTSEQLASLATVSSEADAQPSGGGRGAG